jgi:hypothetical protein
LAKENYFVIEKVFQISCTLRGTKCIAHISKRKIRQTDLTTMNHQDDFSCLQLTSSTHSSSPVELVDHEAILSGKSTRSDNSDKLASNHEAYVPVNFIKPEVYAMIAAWEASALKRKESDAASVPKIKIETRDGDMYEPMRCIPASTPPKRFHRTFWRSITRRVLEHDRKSIIARHWDILLAESDAPGC